jgi:LPXTG-motif cell wall-anchored protein
VTNQQPDASDPDTPGNTPDDPVDAPKQDPVGNWLIPVAAGGGLLLVAIIGFVIWKKKKSAVRARGGTDQ